VVGWFADAAKEQDLAVREALYFDIQEAIMDHCAYIWQYQGMTFHVVHANVYGYYDCAPNNPMHQAYFYHGYKIVG